MIKVKEWLKLAILFLIGGCIYGAIEIAYKGDTHISMFIVGGLAFVLIGGLNNYWSYEMSIIKQMLISAGIITLLEFISGCIVNLWLGLSVWDYSALPFNIYGQVCLLFTVIWFFLSIPAIFLDDWIRFKMFGEQFPRYVVFKAPETQVS